MDAAVDSTTASSSSSWGSAFKVVRLPSLTAAAEAGGYRGGCNKGDKGKAKEEETKRKDKTERKKKKKRGKKETDVDQWREALRKEVRRHTFAFVSFGKEEDEQQGPRQGSDEQHQRPGEPAEAEEEEEGGGLGRLVAEHRDRTRPQFFGEADRFKRRLGAGADGGREEAKSDGQTTEEHLRAKPLGDTGYCMRDNVKEQLQVRLGARMPWPQDPKDDDDDGDGQGTQHKYQALQQALEALYEALDATARGCASALVGDSVRAQLHSMLDPTPPHMRDIIRQRQEAIEAEGNAGDGVSDYTSSSVLLLTHYFNTEKGPAEPCNMHADAGALTLVLDPTAGLQLFDPCSSKWFDCGDVPAIEKAQGVRVDAVILVGEALARLTRGSLAITSHRVVNTGRVRYSTVYKLRPRPDAVGPRNVADYTLLLVQQPMVKILQASDEHGRPSWDTTFDVLVHVFTFLQDLQDVGRCAMVSRAWREAADSHALWSQIYHRYARGISLVLPDEQHEGAKEINYKHLCIEYLRRCRASVDIVELRDHYLQQVRAPRRGGNSTCKTVVVGADAVGKTSLLLRYATRSFPEDYVPTVFDEYTVNLDVDGNTVAYSLWDTAGAECYARLRPLAYPNTDCFLLCFAINDQRSLEDVLTIFLPETKSAWPAAITILVGTKSDLRTSTEQSEALIPVSKGVELARELGLAMYLECSAKSGEGVRELIDLAPKLNLLKQAGSYPPSSKSHGDKKGKCALQ